jgi:hypothetical protein
VHDLGNAVDPEDSLHHFHSQHPGFSGVDVRADDEPGMDIGLIAFEGVAGVGASVAG